jgi:hypothetical protein
LVETAEGVMRHQVAALLAFLVAGPSHATLTTYGPGLASCGTNMCVDMSWSLSTWNEPAQQIVLPLPLPDPSAWELTGGTISSGGSAMGLAHYPQTGVDFIAGRVAPHLDVLDANGVLTGEFVTQQIHVVCWDNQAHNGVLSCYTIDANYILSVTVGPETEGPFTLAWRFEPDWLVGEPLDASFSLSDGGHASLVYSPVPEPSTAALIAVGLLGFAYRRSGVGENIRWDRRGHGQQPPGQRFTTVARLLRVLTAPTTRAETSGSETRPSSEDRAAAFAAGCSTSRRS